MNIKNHTIQKIRKRASRRRRVRAKVTGTTAKPRLAVFRSNKHITAQLIDDQKGTTLAMVSDKKMAKPGRGASSKEAVPALSGKALLAFQVGKEIGAKAKELKITEVVFDRGGNRYHGRVKGLAEGARQEGLKF